MTNIGTYPEATRDRPALFEWRQAVTDSNLSPMARLVAFVLSMHMNADGGSCWPSTATVGREAGLSEPSARKHLARLVELGWLSRRDRPGRTSTFQASYPSHETPTVSQNPYCETPPPKQESYEVAPLQVDDATPTTSQNPTPTTSQNPRTSTNSSIEGVTKTPPFEFEPFWLAYPRKVGKPLALKAWAKAICQTTPGVLLAGCESWAAHWLEAGTEPQFIPHPSTWLNRHQFNDEPPPVSKRGTRSERSAQAGASVAAALAASRTNPIRALGGGR